MSFDDARRHLFEKFGAAQGDLRWYCLDHWSEHLGLDVAQLHRDNHERIGFLPGALEFLQRVRDIQRAPAAGDELAPGNAGPERRSYRTQRPISTASTRRMHSVLRKSARSSGTPCARPWTSIRSGRCLSTTVGRYCAARRPTASGTRSLSRGRIPRDRAMTTSSSYRSTASTTCFNRDVGRGHAVGGGPAVGGGHAGDILTIPTRVGEQAVPLPHGSLRCALLRSTNTLFAAARPNRRAVARGVSRRHGRLPQLRVSGAGVAGVARRICRRHCVRHRDHRRSYAA